MFFGTTSDQRTTQQVWPTKACLLNNLRVVNCGGMVPLGLEIHHHLGRQPLVICQVMKLFKFVLYLKMLRLSHMLLSHKKKKSEIWDLSCRYWSLLKLLRYTSIALKFILKPEQRVPHSRLCKSNRGQRYYTRLRSSKCLEPLLDRKGSMDNSNKLKICKLKFINFQT